MVVFLHVTLHNLVDIDQHKEAANSSETSVSIYPTTWCNIPEKPSSYSSQWGPEILRKIAPLHEPSQCMLTRCKTAKSEARLILDLGSSWSPVVILHSLGETGPVSALWTWRRRECFQPHSRESHTFPVQSVPTSFHETSSWRVKGTGREADQSPPSSAEVKKEWSSPPLPRTSSWRGAKSATS